MPVTLVRATYSDVVFIARHMRKRDAEEILPLTWTGEPEDLAAQSVVGGISTVALSGGAPVACWGAVEIRPCMWNVWMFATDRWAEVALSVTRQIKKEMIPWLISAGAVRADCWSMEGHDEAHRWLECLGARREATLEDYGTERKLYHCYSWTLSRMEKENVYRTIGSQDAKNACSPTTTTPARSASHQRSSSGQRGSSSRAQTASRNEGS